MKNPVIGLLAFGLLVILAGPVDAHHNSAPIYDFSRVITIEGVVTEFQFVHPHARIYLDVTDDTGKVERWLAEGAHVAALQNSGWTGDEIVVGDRITITGAPSRNRSPRTAWREIVLPDGTVLGGGNGFRKERDELLERLEQMRRDRIGR